LVPVTGIWLVGMALLPLHLRAGAPVWAVAVVLVGNVVTFGISVFVGVRRPDVRIGQLFALATAGWAIGPFLFADIAEFVPVGLQRPLVVGGAALTPAAFVAVGWVIALFPDGRHPNRHWRWLSAYLILFVVGFTPVSVWYAATVDLDSVGPLSESFSELMFGASIPALLAALLSVGVRFRSGDRTTRAQIGWLLYAVAIYLLFLLVSGPPSSENLMVGVARDQIFYVPIPVAIAIAILRYRLYEIDRVVSRTVSYALVVAVLGLVYAGLVVTLRGLLPVSGDLPVAVSTLVVAFLFLPVVRRVQRVVDRRFFRSRYDAGQVVARFANDLRGSLDMTEVTGRVGAVVEEVLGPESVTVWVASESR
jgi:hypothetical protein